MIIHHLTPIFWFSKLFVQLRFTYEQESHPEEFFIPYVWQLILCRRYLLFHIIIIHIFTNQLLNLLLCSSFLLLPCVSILDQISLLIISFDMSQYSGFTFDPSSINLFQVPVQVSLICQLPF